MSNGAYMRLIPWLAMLFMGLVWGLSFSMGKIAMTSGGTPLGVAFWQSIVSGALLLIYTFVRGRPMPLHRQALKMYVVLALLGTAIPASCFYFAAPHVPAGVLSITVALIPMLTYGLALLLRSERLSWIRFTGIFCGAISILLLVGPENSLPDRAALPWVLLACLSALCYSLENVYLAMPSLPDIGPIRVACGMNVMAAIILGPTAILSGHMFIPSFPFGTVEWTIIGLGVITAVAYSMFVMTIAMAGPLFASQVGYVVTLAGVFWGMAIFGETHSNWVWASLGIMIVGMALVTPRRKGADVSPDHESG